MARLIPHDGLNGPQRYLAIMVVSCATILTAMDSTLVNIALPTMMGELDVTAASSVLIINASQIAHAGFAAAALGAGRDHRLPQGLSRRAGVLLGRLRRLRAVAHARADRGGARLSGHRCGRDRQRAARDDAPHLSGAAAGARARDQFDVRREFIGGRADGCGCRAFGRVVAVSVPDQHTARHPGARHRLEGAALERNREGALRFQERADVGADVRAVRAGVQQLQPWRRSVDRGARADGGARDRADLHPQPARTCETGAAARRVRQPPDPAVARGGAMQFHRAVAVVRDVAVLPARHRLSPTCRSAW